MKMKHIPENIVNDVYVSIYVVFGDGYVSSLANEITRSICLAFTYFRFISHYLNFGRNTTNVE